MDKITKKIMIEYDHVKYECIFSPYKWEFGQGVFVQIKSDDVELTSKVLCSSDSPDYDRLSNLSTESLINEAINLFKEKYPFKDLTEIKESGFEVICGWPVES